MLELALNHGKSLMKLKDIAKKENISEKYLSQIIIPLKGAGFVSSTRGAHGGYVLKKPPAQITVKDIVELLEGDISLVECVENPSLCYRTTFCSTRDVWSKLSTQISEVLSSVSLEDLKQNARQKIKHSKYTYQI